MVAVVALVRGSIGSGDPLGWIRSDPVHPTALQIAPVQPMAAPVLPSMVTLWCHHPWLPQSVPVWPRLVPVWSLLALR